MTSPTPQLIIQLRGQIVQTLPLREGVLTIGRTPDNDIALPHPLVARRHAELRAEGESLLVTDLESASGTLLGGEKLLPGQPALVTPGAVLQIGPFALIYQTEPDEEDVPALKVTVRDQPVPPQPARRPEPRPRFPAPRPRGPLSRYLDYLPAPYQESDFLGRYLMLFEAIWEPMQQRQDHIAAYFDPRTCPEPMLPWLAGWLDLSLPAGWPEERRRGLVREAMDLYRWRGTRYGIARMIEVCTGLSAEVIDEPGQSAVIRVRVRLPADSGVDRSTIEQLILSHKPAHVGYILEIRP